MTQSHQQLELLSIEQVANLLGVSTKTVRRLIEREQLHFHRVGGQIRIAREDFRGYLNACRH
jgi:excisionase family DNA binding protein